MPVDNSRMGRGVPCQLAPGMRIGSCELLLGVARGGMAQVWAACQHGARGFSRLVALKTVLPELAEPEFEALFLDEARLAARIHHPNVCEVFELVEDGGVLGLAMEWVDGDTLHALLNSSTQRIDAHIAAQIVAETARGLHAAHELRDEGGAALNLVHRDVSPQNVLISRDGRVKVADFGVAKAAGASREKTASGQIRGKLNYLSPEQAQGAPLDRRSDVFSLGILLYVASLGAHPFCRSGERKDKQVLNLLTGRMIPPSAVDPEYPAALEAIVLKAMRYEPNERFATADEMRRALVGWITRTRGAVTEQDVARSLRERRGSFIEQREARISAALRESRQRGAATAWGSSSAPGPRASLQNGALHGFTVSAPFALPEPTVVLTEALRVRRRQWLRQTLQLGVSLCAAAALGGLGALALRPVEPTVGDAAAADVARPAASARPAGASTSLARLASSAAKTTAGSAAVTTRARERASAVGNATGAEGVARDAVALNAVAPDAVARDAVARDAVARDAVVREAPDSEDGASRERVASVNVTRTELPGGSAARGRPRTARAALGASSTASSSAARAGSAKSDRRRAALELGPRENEL